MICCWRCIYQLLQASKWPFHSPKMEVTKQALKRSTNLGLLLRPLPPKKLSYPLKTGGWKMNFPGGCQQGCSGRNSAATERTDRVATAFAEDTGPWEGGTRGGTMGKGDLSWSVGWGLGVVDLLFDLGIVDLCRGKCFVKVREVGFGGFCGFGIAGNRIYWIWVGKNGSGLKMYFLLKMGIC